MKFWSLKSPLEMFQNEVRRLGSCISTLNSHWMCEAAPFPWVWYSEGLSCDPRAASTSGQLGKWVPHPWHRDWAEHKSSSIDLWMSVEKGKQGSKISTKQSTGLHSRKVDLQVPCHWLSQSHSLNCLVPLSKDDPFHCFYIPLTVKNRELRELNVQDKP